MEETSVAEDWIIKMMELVEIAKLTSLVWEKAIKTVLKSGSLITEFLLKEGKTELMI